MSIRSKLSIFIIVLIALLSAAGGGVLYMTEHRHLLARAGQEQEALLRSFARSAENMLSTGDELGVVKYLRILKDTFAVEEAVLVDREFRVVAASGDAVIGAPYRLPRPEATISKGDIVRHYYTKEGRRFLSLSLALPGGTAILVYSRVTVEQSVSAALQAVARRILAIFAAILLLGILGAVLIARTITGPLRKIVQATHHIAENDLEHRVHIPSNDEIGALSRDFNRMAEKLGELDRMKEDFVASVTHELRSPISAIQSYINLVISDMSKKEYSNAFDDLTSMRNNALRLESFIDTILDLAKLESHKESLNAAPMPLNQVVSEVASLFKAKAGEMAVNLTADLTDQPTTLTMDSDKIRQVLTNLLGNALKFTPKGGTVTLRTSVDQGKRIVICAVKDSGIGIAPENLARIFNKFEQVNEARKLAKGSKGTGLGLAIAKAIITAHNGQIWVESTVGQGSTFLFSLPINEDHA